MSAHKRPGRRKRSAAATLRPFWIVLLLLVFAGAIGGYYAADWPGFRPTRVVVVGNRRVSSHAIAARAAIDRHTNLWLQNMGAAAKRVSAIADIGRVTIRRGLPASVTIAVTERAPFAQIRSGDAVFVVDRDLRILQDDSSATLPALILNIKPARAGTFIKDARVRKLRGDFDALTAAHVAVSSLRYDRFGDLIATTPRHVQILLGDDEDLGRKVGLIGPILSQTSARKIAAIDLRAPSTPVVVYQR